LLRLWNLSYISAIPIWRKDTDKILSNIQSTVRCILGYQLTMSSWRLSIYILPVYNVIVLDRSQLGYVSHEVRSWKFNLQFYIMDLTITVYTWVFLLLFSTQGVNRKLGTTIFLCPKEVCGNPNCMVVQRMLLFGYCSVDTSSSAEANLHCFFI
jgi:hypothetical protein